MRGSLKPLKSSSTMTSGQKYSGKGGTTTSTRTNGSNVEQTATPTQFSIREQSVINGFRMAANPLGSSLSLPSLTVCISKSTADGLLQVTALRFYRDEQLERLQEEYRFCRQGVGRTPDMDFVQATLNDIFRLNKMINSLAISMDESYRVLGDVSSVSIN